MMSKPGGVLRPSRVGPRRATLALLAVGLACGACESDSPSTSGNPGGGGGDEDAPLAVIEFPPASALTDEPEVNLAIAASDATDVVSVRVAGLAALFGPDGLWRVAAPLREGENTLFVETRDSLGNEDPRAAQLAIRREGALWIEPSALAFDTLAGEALALDPPSFGLFGVAPGTGARTLRSGVGLGIGPLFRDARDSDVVPSRHAAVVTDGLQDAVLLVDLGSGNRTILSSPLVGSGPTPFDLHGLAVDESRNRVLVLDDFLAAVLAVDLVTGARTELSSAAVGSGPPLVGPRRIALDLFRNRALVTALVGGALVAIDLASGDRTVLSGGATGSGPAFVTPFDVLVDPFQDRVLVVDPGARALFEVDPLTGGRAILSSSARGSGPVWLRPSGVALHLGSVPLVIDPATDALFEVGATSGDRRVLTRVARGSGPQLARPAALALDLSGPERLLVADEGGLFRVDLANGARTLVSGASVGTGAPFVALSDVAVARFGSDVCVSVLDAGRPAVVGVDPLDGTRTLLSGDGVGFGAPFAAPRRMALVRSSAELSCPTTALVVDKALGGPPAVLHVELTTGDRFVASDATHGVGPLFSDPVAIDFDALSSVAYVLDAGTPGQILSVDRINGDRAQVFDFVVGLASLTDLAFEPTHGHFLVTLADPRAVVSANPVTQTLRVVSDILTGSGPLFGRPAALELGFVVASTPVVYVADSLRGAIVAVDPVLGDRVIVSK